MEKFEVVISEEFANKRIDSVIPLLFSDFSRSQVLKIIETGNLTIDGKEIKKASTKVKGGNTICFSYAEPTDLNLEPEDLSLEIVYEDEDVIVVNKPQNLVVHPAAGNGSGTLVNGLLYHSKNNLSDIGGEFRPGIVHRIDKDTSGLLMVAKNNAAHQHLSEQLREKTVTRKYIALVYGAIEHDKGTIDAPIGISQVDRKKRAVTSINSKHAVTHFKVISKNSAFSLVECQLETGRTHQIRVHFEYIKHPLVGDPKYFSRKNAGGEGQYLHAYKLGFIHPRTGEYLEFNAPLPEYFEEKLKEVNLSYEFKF